MGGNSKIYVCHKCSKSFPFRADKENHEKDVIHRLHGAEEHDSRPFNTKNAGFNPTITTLHRILSVLLDQNSLNKTALSQAANMQYRRFANCLQLLESGKYIEQVIEDGKIIIRLTAQGRELARLLSELDVKG